MLVLLHATATPLPPATDGVLAQDMAQARQVWHIREGITEALRHRGGCGGEGH